MRWSLVLKAASLVLGGLGLIVSSLLDDAVMEETKAEIKNDLLNEINGTEES